MHAKCERVRVLRVNPLGRVAEEVEVTLCVGPCGPLPNSPLFQGYAGSPEQACGEKHSVDDPQFFGSASFTDYIQQTNHEIDIEIPASCLSTPNVCPKNCIGDYSTVNLNNYIGKGQAVLPSWPWSLLLSRPAPPPLPSPIPAAGVGPCGCHVPPCLPVSHQQRRGRSCVLQHVRQGKGGGYASRRVEAVVVEVVRYGVTWGCGGGGKGG